MTTVIDDPAAPTELSTRTPNPSPTRAMVEGCVAMAFLGASTAVSAHLTDYPLYGGQAARYLLATAVLFAILRRRERTGRSAGRTEAPAAPRRTRLTPRDWLLISALAGSGLVLFNIFVIAALRRTDAATLGSVLACSPLLLAVAGPW